MGTQLVVSTPWRTPPVRPSAYVVCHDIASTESSHICASGYLIGVLAICYLRKDALLNDTRCAKYRNGLGTWVRMQ